MALIDVPAAPSAGLARPSPLLALPDELLSQVAFFCALSSTPGPPSGLVPLLCTHSRLAGCLSSDANPSLYGRILRATWDLAAVRRRYGPDALADVRAESAELRRRWTILQTVRALGDDVGGWLTAHEADGERLLEETMLEVILLLMENDGLNLPHILGWAHLPTFVFRLYEAVMLSRSLEPGFPVDSASHACHCMLTMWLLEAGENLRQETLSLGQDATAETEEQTQEKAFVLRPLVFSPQYSLFVAPWNMRSLPQIGCDVDRGIENRHLGERRPAVTSTDNSLAQHVPLHVVRRLGREWEMKPPKLGRAAIFGLLNSLDLDPSIGGVTTSASNSSTSSLDFLYTPEELAMDVPGRTPDYDPISQTYLRQSVPILGLRSASFDNDWRRMTLCKSLADKGMTIAHWRGKFEGTWIGSFAYFDFNGFADVLAGDQEAIYTNAFGQQANHIQLTETVAYVPRSKLGGTGPAFAAGYPSEGEEDVTRPCPIEEELLDDDPDSEWVKELLVTGIGRSKWGKFTYRGRVRAWDGLLSVEKRYDPNDEPVTQAVSAKWLYRGYVMSDCRWIGKWRDTYTDEDSLGYEGPFCLRRQSEPYLLPRRQHGKTGPMVKVHPPARMATADPATASRARPMDVASFERAMRGRNAAAGASGGTYAGADGLGSSSTGPEGRIAGELSPSTSSQITALPRLNLQSSVSAFPSLEHLPKESGERAQSTLDGPPHREAEVDAERTTKRLRLSPSGSDGPERSLSPSASASNCSISSPPSSGSGSPGHRRITIASLLSDDSASERS